MNCFTFNVRGGGNKVKRHIIGNIVQKINASFCFIHETKYLFSLICWLLLLGGNNYVEWSANGAFGAAGGLVIMWKKGLLNLILNFKGEGFIGVNADWKVHNYFFLNVILPVT